VTLLRLAAGQGFDAGSFLTTETIARQLQEMTIFVATEQSGEIVGTNSGRIVNAEEGHVRGMAVVPGIAARLLLRAESQFRKGNCKESVSTRPHFRRETTPCE